MKGDNMSHEEIWDDSALQSSWDDALAEYKVCYHIHHTHFIGLC